ncbi:UDP-N-acetylmuramoyl-tripeptide--D-alanyl-D-alanine ligase [Terrihabitans soli]|uniref:UDP-N-acetylmuramoyl-tripeptide--D-alanyl-D-alanine ligase n=1 Tax=Terrihabitans soli TaxID=708113 RepID=A0A6S6QU01_9HYPH|nr:UDP-N-acetylmuramoylalanyl-D-glutamyl-2,6-diaminopimelate--D-alanyl-D-alanine ligase [Terrihabitans soli]BCJ91417.1 UDP-N-acetylmuramoyl-tripeptide--D-alanyl-D-alanine ligase [Terrihabitans soli]
MSGAALWTGEEFAAAVGGRVIGTMPQTITGISIDSRTIKPGEAFFAITGDKMDGHDYAKAALENLGSIAVISEKKAPRVGRVWPAVIVDDVLAALTRLAVAARARSDAKIFAVTGSVGKTSTKEMLRLALGVDGEVHASVASFNNHWGVPLSLARLPKSAAYAVFEIGMNHAGEITPLTKLVRPHVAIVTNVEPVHLEHFASVNAIADAKAEIFTGLEPGGFFAIINADNAYAARLADEAKKYDAQIMTFGAAPDASARLLMYSVLSDRTAITASILGKDIAYSLGAPGRHLVQNSLAVLLSARLADVDVKAAAEALGQFQPPVGRGQRHVLHVRGGRATLLDESYNANPASMRAAIEVLGQTRSGRRIAVLGDMLELGHQSEDMHRELAGPLDQARVDLVFAAGPHMRALFDALPASRRGAWAATSAELEEAVLDAIKPGDVVMVKGSLGSKMGPIVAALNRRFAAAESAA